MCMRASVYVYVHMSAPAVEVTGIKSSRTGVTGGGDPPTMGAGNYTRVFWKNNKCSSLPSCQPQITGICLWLAHLTLNGADIVPFTDKVICLRSGNFQPNLTCFSISVSFFLVLGTESKTLNILRKY